MSTQPDNDTARRTVVAMRKYLLGAVGERDRMWHGYAHEVSNLPHVCNQLHHAMRWFALLQNKNWSDFCDKWGPVGLCRFIDKSKSYDENLAALREHVVEFVDWVEGV